MDEFRVVDAVTGRDLSGALRGTLPPGWTMQFRLQTGLNTLRKVKVQRRTVTLSPWEDHHL